MAELRGEQKVAEEPCWLISAFWGTLRLWRSGRGGRWKGVEKGGNGWREWGHSLRSGSQFMRDVHYRVKKKRCAGIERAAGSIRNGRGSVRKMSSTHNIQVQHWSGTVDVRARWAGDSEIRFATRAPQRNEHRRQFSPDICDARTCTSRIG